MGHLIHFEITRSNAKHCIAILENDAKETLSFYYIQPHSRLMAHLLALGVEWTVTRLWKDAPWYKRLLWKVGKADRSCPVCGVKC